jgi:hypothetical protein
MKTQVGKDRRTRAKYCYKGQAYNDYGEGAKSHFEPLTDVSHSEKHFTPSNFTIISKPSSNCNP